VSEGGVLVFCFLSELLPLLLVGLKFSLPFSREIIRLGFGAAFPSGRYIPRSMEFAMLAIYILLLLAQYKKLFNLVLLTLFNLGFDTLDCVDDGNLPGERMTFC